MSKHVIQFFTKKTCSLCDSAKFVVQKSVFKVTARFYHSFLCISDLVQFQSHFSFVEVDIELPENSQWSELYKHDIPVVHLDHKEVSSL